ncbi:MAG: type II toxin-antitoxin system VapC family toxin [Abitibacteriaceae bacterium]|nr:type II toxin-antitoxin system VapC family toxin [Abditibacteriaceae bacterium]MBV9867043.1 type II toxin-antitoxin system VapC family toxin [Abditibacteriaceae bacterium]
MAIYFFDSSAIVKRYVNETGTAWVNSPVDPLAGNLNHLARITGVEVVAAIARRQRIGSVSAPAAALLLTQFQHEFANEYLLAEMTLALIQQAMSLAQTHALRAYDAVQLAAAMQLNARYLAVGLSLTLVSADMELNAAALMEGLAVEDPNTHP